MSAQGEHGPLFPSPKLDAPMDPDPSFDIVDARTARVLLAADAVIQDTWQRRLGLETPSSSSSLFSVALAYAVQDACKTDGNGRTVRGWPPNNNNVSTSSATGVWDALAALTHTVTACDMMDGSLVAVYDVQGERVWLLPQTLGTMSYCTMVVQAMACLYFATMIATSEQQQEGARGAVLAAGAALWTVASLLAVYACHGIPFLTDSDRAHFGVTVGIAACLGVVTFFGTHRPEQGAEACVYALMAMSNAVYRSAENPYAGIVCAVLLVRQWQKAFRFAEEGHSSYEYYYYYYEEKEENDDKKKSSLTIKGGETTSTTIRRAPPGWLALMDLTLTSIALCFSAAVGLAPQCAPERWPFYCGIAIYMTFAAAYQRQLRLIMMMSASNNNNTNNNIINNNNTNVH